jgi:hypothetical protein
MENEELPRRLEYQAQAFSAVVDEVAEDHSKALESALFDVEERLWARLNDLQEQCHPRVECVAKTRLHELVVNAVRPRDRPQTEVEHFQDHLSRVSIDKLVIHEGRLQGWQDLRHIFVK